MPSIDYIKNNYRLTIIIKDCNRVFTVYLYSASEKYVITYIRKMFSYGFVDEMNDKKCTTFYPPHRILSVASEKLVNTEINIE